MNTKFTILIAAGLLIAGVSQAQSTVAANDVAFNNPRHAVAREHREIRKHHKEIRRNKHRIHHHRKHHK